MKPQGQPLHGKSDTRTKNVLIKLKMMNELPPFV